MINTSTKCCVLSLIRVVFFASSKKEHDNVFLLTFLLYFFIFQCLDRFSRFLIHDILFYPALKKMFCAMLWYRTDIVGWTVDGHGWMGISYLVSCIKDNSSILYLFILRARWNNWLTRQQHSESPYVVIKKRKNDKSKEFSIPFIL